MERKASRATAEPMQEAERKESGVSKKSMENMERKESLGNKSVRSVMSRRKSNYTAPKPKKPARSKPAAVSCGVHLDSSMSVSAEARFKRKNSQLVHKLSSELPLTFNEIESLLLIYHKLQLHGYHNADGMTTKQFVDVLHETFNMTDDKLNQYVAMILHISHSSLFSMDSWVRAISLFLKGTFEEKMQHCYNVYDSPKRNNLRKDHLLHLMEGCFTGEEAPEEVTLDLIEMVLKKMDGDQSGIFSYDNYKAAIIHEPLLMECFGQCLPDRLSTQSFLTTFTPNPERF